MDTKTCTRCGQEKPVSDFWKRSHDKFRSHCKQCGKELNKQWEREHPDAAKKRHRDYYYRNRAEKIQYNKEWKQNNPLLVRYANVRSNSYHRGLEFALSFDEWAQRFWQQPCVCCGRDSHGGVDRVDNSQGYVEGNMVACCRRCNAIKSNMTLEELYDHLSTMLKRLPNLMEAHHASSD